MKTRTDEECDRVQTMNQNIQTAAASREIKDIYKELTTAPGSGEIRTLANCNPSDSTHLFFPYRNEIKHPKAQEALSDRIGTPLKVQALEVSRNGYEGWDTFTVRTKENYCLAVVGQVDRAASEISKQAAHLFAAAPELLAKLKNMFDGYTDLHDGLSDMIEDGRLRESDIPDDYRWLVDKLVKLSATARHAEELLTKINEVSK